jgi:acetate kinase
MAASLGGLDALVFTAGVGEHSPGVRAAVCARLAFLSVELDADLNERSVPDRDVASSESAVRVLVIAAREELVVARAVRALLRRT